MQDFFEKNRRWCNKVKPYFPHSRFDLLSHYEKAVAHYMNLSPHQVVLDIGGGKTCPFAKYKDPAMNPKIIAMDVSIAELEENRDVDEKVVADVMKEIPFREEIDLLVSSSVLEHLENIERFIVNSHRALVKNGYWIHKFPCKFAPFALINQSLPRNLSRKLLYFFIPSSKGICGFPAFYDRCYYTAITGLLRKYGFQILDIRLSYFQAPYYDFFVPLYLVNIFYEFILYTLDLKDFCAYLVVTARKR